jgi:hypothetical protein
MMNVTSGTSIRPFRRTALVAVATLAALIITFAVTAGTGSAAPAATISPGIGTALAQTATVGPSFANLALTFTFGRSIAGHQNTVAQASSQAIDLGQIGSTLAGRGCDGSDPTLAADKQPQAARVDSRDANPTIDEDENFLGGLPLHKHAEAHTTPFGKAVTTTLPFGVAGLLEVGGGTATATSGIVGDVREAKSIVDVSGIRLVGAVGLVELSGLHWEATWSSKNPDGVVGTFGIANAKIAGVPLPTNDPSKVLQTLNTALAPAGIKLTPPLAHQEGGVLFVDPLGVSVVPSATRDQLAAKVLQNVQSLRQQVADALIAQDCGNATYITIADLMLGSVTGAGVFKVELGGVQATSAETPPSGFTFGGPQLLTTGGLEPSLGSDGTFTTPDLGGGLGTLAPAAAPSRSTRQVRPVLAAQPAGKRGGAMALVGLAGLALLGLIAEGDRRKMRRAQREIPVT